jgi:hypothetical protein
MALAVIGVAASLFLGSAYLERRKEQEDAQLAQAQDEVERLAEEAQKRAEQRQSHEMAKEHAKAMEEAKAREKEPFPGANQLVDAPDSGDAYGSVPDSADREEYDANMEQLASRAAIGGRRFGSQYGQERDRRDEILCEMATEQFVPQPRPASFARNKMIQGYHSSLDSALEVGGDGVLSEDVFNPSVYPTQEAYSRWREYAAEREVTDPNEFIDTDGNLQQSFSTGMEPVPRQTAWEAIHTRPTAYRSSLMGTQRVEQIPLTRELGHESRLLRSQREASRSRTGEVLLKKSWAQFEKDPRSYKRNQLQKPRDVRTCDASGDWRIQKDTYARTLHKTGRGYISARPSARQTYPQYEGMGCDGATTHPEGTRTRLNDKVFESQENYATISTQYATGPTFAGDAQLREGLNRGDGTEHKEPTPFLQDGRSVYHGGASIIPGIHAEGGLLKDRTTDQTWGGMHSSVPVNGIYPRYDPIERNIPRAFNDRDTEMRPHLVEGQANEMIAIREHALPRTVDVANMNVSNNPPLVACG